MSATIPWVLADDLSGALEAGVAWRKAGWRVRLPLGESAEARMDATLELLSGFVVFLFSTESRNLSPEEAGRRVRDALALCARKGGSLLFKKIDSTLRGPIAAELNALIETLAPPLVVITPANPALGRTVVDGELRVHGKPIAETDFARDPTWPVAHGLVSQVLREGGVRGVSDARAASRAGESGLSDTLAAARKAGARVVVADAEQAGDLPALVNAARRIEPGTVFVGSGALAPLLVQPRVPAATIPAVHPQGSIIFVLGSKHEVNRLQLERMRSNYDIPVARLSMKTQRFDRVEVAREAAWQGVLALVIEDDARVAPAKALEAFGEALRWIREQAPIRGIFATGGETARAVCDALEVAELEVVGEVQPGVARVIARGAGGPLLMTIKPGGFGTPDVLREAMKAFRH